MNFYIAGAGAEAAMIHELAEGLKRLGGTITLEWWPGMLESKLHDRDLTDVAADEFAEQDLRGVLEADVLWLVVPTAKVGAGCYFETGYLRGVLDCMGRIIMPPKKIVASGDWRRSIFLRSTRLVDHRFATHADALAWIQAQLVEAA